MRGAILLAVLSMFFVFRGSPSALAEAMRAFETGSLKEIASESKGRPVIVHFWGLTCGNCMVELKDWGTFARAHPDVRIVLVNWDQRGADEKRMAKALEDAGLGGATSFGLAGGFEERLRFAVDREWIGELPYTRVIKPDGTVTTFSGAADFQELASWLAVDTPH